MKKITLLLLLTLSVFGLQAQTYQLNYDSIRVNKTAGTGGTALYGKVYLKNVSARAAGDSILSVLNGRIFKVPYSAFVTSVTGTTNQITVTGTTTPTLSIPSAFIAPGTIRAMSTMESGSTGIAGKLSFRRSSDGALTSSVEQTNDNKLTLTSAGGTRLFDISADTVMISALTNGLVKSTSGKLSNAVAGTDYLTPTGSGSGLSGVVLTTGTQSIAGQKTFNDPTILNGTTSLNGTTTASSMFNINRSAIGSFHALAFRTAGTPKWYLGQWTGGSTNFEITNVNTGSEVASIVIDGSTNAAAFTGSISSTPQGTLYGTASGSITSAQLATSLTDETGTGSAVFSASPTFTGTIIGASSNFSGSMGIGISPTYPLHVSKSVTSNYIASLNNTNTTAGQSFGLFINAGTNSSDRALTINNADNTVTLLSLLGNGDLEIGGSNATKASGTAWINPSDSRLKENIQPYSKGLKEVLLINPKVWNYNKASGVKDTITKHVSPIAQELKKVMPEMVGSYKGKLAGKETTLYNIDGSDYVMLLINAVKDQQAIIEKLNQRITVLEKK